MEGLKVRVTPAWDVYSLGDEPVELVDAIDAFVADNAPTWAEQQAETSTAAASA